MNIDYPTQEQLRQLENLWQEAFGDTEEFLAQFYTHGFAADRCRCVSEDSELWAALYWFDCLLDNRPIAYLYAIATAKSHRGQGLCRILVENTLSLLEKLGYVGAILVPAEKGLFPMYEKMGFCQVVSIAEFSCDAISPAAQMRKLSVTEFCSLRREFLPPGGVVQESGMEFLETMADFYAGEDFLVTASREDAFFPELLGNPAAAPHILSALGRQTGHFRTVGAEKPFALYRSFDDAPSPSYFSLAFD